MLFYKGNDEENRSFEQQFDSPLDATSKVVLSNSCSLLFWQREYVYENVYVFLMKQQAATLLKIRDVLYEKEYFSKRLTSIQVQNVPELWR